MPWKDPADSAVSCFTQTPVWKQGRWEIATLSPSKHYHGTSRHHRSWWSPALLPPPYTPLSAMKGSVVEIGFHMFSSSTLEGNMRLGNSPLLSHQEAWRETGLPATQPLSSDVGRFHGTKGKRVGLGEENETRRGHAFAPDADNFMQDTHINQFSAFVCSEVHPWEGFNLMAHLHLLPTCPSPAEGLYWPKHWFISSSERTWLLHMSFWWDQHSNSC